MFQKIKVWWALRKANKIEKGKVLTENDITKDEKLFLEESDELKKLINKTLIMNKEEKPVENTLKTETFNKKRVIKRNSKKKPKKVTKKIVKGKIKQKTKKKTVKPKIKKIKKKVKAKTKRK